jgi:hypothetical protein
MQQNDSMDRERERERTVEKIDNHAVISHQMELPHHLRGLQHILMEVGM